jgi:nitrate/nitrite transporter NarK
VVGFAAWFRNRPEEKPGVNAAELVWIHSGGTESVTAHARTPWMRFLTSRNLQALCLMYACQTYGWYFYITYLPGFLEQHYGVPPSSALGSLYKGGPLWLGAVGCLLGGLLTDRVVRRTGNLRWGRRLFGVVGHSLTGLCFLACLAAPSAFWFFAAISLAGFFTDLAMGADWAVCQDIGRRHAAVVAGFMNMIGNLGGALAGWMSGFVLERSLAARAARLAVDVQALSAAEKTAGLMQGYRIIFLISAAVYVVGVFCWLRIDPTEAVVPDGDEQI